jgi:hypothetical protein
MAAVEALVLRALETAGKRAVGRDRYRHRGLAAWELHTTVQATPPSVPRLLDGAFTTVPHVAGRLGVDPEKLTAALSSYVGRLLVTGARHDADELREHLAGVTRAELTPV